MDRKEFSNEPIEPPTAAKLLISNEVAQRVSAIHLMEAEVSVLTERLNNLTTLKQQLEYSGKEPKAYIQQLMERRVSLCQELRTARAGIMPFPPPGGAPNIYSYSQNVLLKISDLLSWWSILPVPIMIDGPSLSPNVAGTSGQIETGGLYPGGLTYGGAVYADGVQDPNALEGWIHNWHCSIIFPPAPKSGKLLYRFSVSNETHIYHAPVQSGSVMAFVEVGTTPDVSQPIQNWNSTNLVTIMLPKSSVADLNPYSDMPITGEIDVQQGQRPAVGLLFWITVSVASGYVQFTWGNFGTHLTPGPDQTVGPMDYGKIEYHYYPHPFFETVSQGLLVPPPFGG